MWGAKWRSFITLLVRLMHVDRGRSADVGVFTDAVGKKFLGWIRRVAPAPQGEEVAYAYQFTVALMVDSAAQWQHDRLCRLAEGACSSFEFSEIRDCLLPYSRAGAKALLGLT